jgi:hypothetical protein
MHGASQGNARSAEEEQKRETGERGEGGASVVRAPGFGGVGAVAEPSRVVGEAAGRVALVAGRTALPVRLRQRALQPVRVDKRQHADTRKKEKEKEKEKESGGAR